MYFINDTEKGWFFLSVEIKTVFVRLNGLKGDCTQVEIAHFTFNGDNLSQFFCTFSNCVESAIFPFWADALTIAVMFFQNNLLLIVLSTFILQKFSCVKMPKK